MFSPLIVDSFSLISAATVYALIAGSPWGYLLPSYSEIIHLTKICRQYVLLANEQQEILNDNENNMEGKVEWKLYKEKYQESATMVRE